MKKKYSLLMSILLSMIIVTSTLTVKVDAQEYNNLSATLNGRGFQEPESLGAAIDTVTSLTSAVYDEYNDTLIAYAMSNGGYFNAVDVKTNELIYSEKIDDIQQVWAHIVTDDHVVYMAALGKNNDGQLLRYNPEIGKIEDLGIPYSGYQFWSATTDGKDNIYIGTFKEHAASVIQFNVATGEFSNLGVVDAVNKLGYVRSIAYHNNNLYLGMGAQGLLYKMNLETKEIHNITANAYDLINKPGDKNDIKYLYDMAVVKNHLVTRFDHDGEGAVLLYNLIDERFEDKIFTKKHDGGADDFGSFGWNDLVDLDGVTYITYERHIHEINTNTLQDRRIDNAKFLGHRGGAVYDFGKGPEFVSSTRLGSIAKFSLETGKKEELVNVMKGSPLKLHNLGKDHNGDLYVTTYPGGPKGAKYSMKDEMYTDYNQGQAEGLVAGEVGEMYFGIYPGAKIQRMDTTTQKITDLFELKTTHEQDRPYIMKYVDGLLMIGTIPDYKKLGGTLTIYNPNTEEVQTYRNVVENQSIVGLAKKGNLIFGSTSVKGGLDVAPSETTPVIFVWDINAEEKIKEIKLELPGLGTTPMISGLTFDDQGNLWGAVDGHLFTMDSQTYEITKSKNIYPNVQNRGMWRPVHIEFGDDGFVYTDLGGRLTVVDPNTDSWEHTTVATPKEVDFMTLSYDNNGQQNIYIVQNDPIGIDVVRVVDVEPTHEEDTKLFAKVLLNVENGGFEHQEDMEVFSSENDPKKPLIKGWSSLFDVVSENVSYEVSNERAYSGESSLKITDSHDKETVFVISDPISVTAGVSYTAETMLYLNDGMNTLVLRYYDENGKQVNTDTDSVNIIHVRTNYGEWQKVSATLKAPVGSVSARISLGSSNYFTTSGAFYDDVKLYSSEEVIALKFKKIEATLKQAESLETDKYTEDTLIAVQNAVSEAHAVKELGLEQERIYDVGISKSRFESRIMQIDLDGVEGKIRSAIDLLKLIDDGIDPEIPVNPEIPVDPENPVNPTEPGGPKHPESPKEEVTGKGEVSLPATGQSSSPLMYAALMLLVSGVGVLVVRIKHSKKLN